MNSITLNVAKALIFTTTACALGLGATTVHAAGGDEGAPDAAQASQDGVQGKVWVQEIVAVSENPPVIRNRQAAADMIVPLNINFEAYPQPGNSLARRYSFDRDADLRSFDLLEDSPIFIGTKGASEFDTRDARNDSGSYPKAMGVNPLYTVAGAGLSTSF